MDVDEEDVKHYATHIDGKDLSLLDDVRVEPLVKSYWWQSLGIYNYYTPYGYPCGCVATAMAQILRYHKWPRAAVPQFSQLCQTDRYATPVETNMLTAIGGVYDWDNMPLAPDQVEDTMTLAQTQACATTAASL